MLHYHYQYFAGNKDYAVVYTLVNVFVTGTRKIVHSRSLSGSVKPMLVPIDISYDSVLVPHNAGFINKACWDSTDNAIVYDKYGLS